MQGRVTLVVIFSGLKKTIFETRKKTTSKKYIRAFEYLCELIRWFIPRLIGCRLFDNAVGFYMNDI